MKMVCKACADNMIQSHGSSPSEWLDGTQIGISLSLGLRTAPAEAAHCFDRLLQMQTAHQVVVRQAHTVLAAAISAGVICLDHILLCAG